MNLNNRDNFAIDFYTKLYEQNNKTKHLIVSPFLVESLLSLIYLNSDGATAEELKALLQLKCYERNTEIANYFAENLSRISQTQCDTQFQIRSEIWIEEWRQVNGDFKENALNYFHTHIKEFNINDDKVHLNQLFNNNDHLQLQLCLLSIIDFQYKWLLPFSPYRTGLSDFYLLNNTKTTTAMLYDNEMFVHYIELEKFDIKVIELPYEHDNELVMLIMLPNKRNGLNDFLKNLKHLDFHKICDAMQMESVHILLPKFSIEFECTLKTVLEEMGLKSFFNRNLNLKDFCNMTNNFQGFSDFHHKVSIEIDETGCNNQNETELKVLNLENMINRQQKSFHANHPFFFVIKTSSVIILMGHVLNV